MNKYLLIIFLLFVTPFNIVADGGHADEEIVTVDQFSKTFDNGIMVEMKIDNGKAFVGKLCNITASATKNGQALKNVKFDVGFYHHEDKKFVYKNTFYSKEGSLSFKHQFFDGAEHQIQLTASPISGDSFSPSKIQMSIEVEGYQPPTSVLVKSLLFLVGLTAIGMVIGYVIAVKKG